MSRRAIDESDRGLAKSRGGDGVPTRIWAFATGREPEDEGLPQLDLFPLRLRRGLDPVWWGVGGGLDGWVGDGTARGGIMGSGLARFW